MTPHDIGDALQDFAVGWEFSGIVGKSSIGAAFGDWIAPTGLKPWFGSRLMAMSLSSFGRGRPSWSASHSLHQVRSQEDDCRPLIEELRRIGGGFPEEARPGRRCIAELNGLSVVSHASDHSRPPEISSAEDIWSWRWQNGRVDEAELHCGMSSIAMPRVAHVIDTRTARASRSG